MPNHRWIFPLHDPLLEYYNGLGLDPYQIGNRMGFAPSTIVTHLTRLGLKRNLRPLGRPGPREDQHIPIKSKPNPLGIAFMWLGKRLEERNGEYRLDNRPTNLRPIMRETNRLLQAAGADQIGPEEWRV